MLTKFSGEEIIKWFIQRKHDSSFKIVGLVSLIGYMVIVLFSWMYSNLITGHTFFMMGEPILIIKYLEWMGGIIGLFTAIFFFTDEIKK